MNDGTQAREGKLLAKFGKRLNEVTSVRRGVYTKILLKRWNGGFYHWRCEDETSLMRWRSGSLTSFAVVR
ncbi:MAG: hypothetical protein ACTS68_01880 [Candidatus Hodgkinia cicadicola]